MLKKLDKVLTGDALKILCDMGHGDEIVIADANFPAARVAQRLVRCPASTVAEIYAAIHEIFPLDADYNEHPACVMEVSDGDKAKGMGTPEVWGEFDAILKSDHPTTELGKIERFEFYERAKRHTP